MGLQLIPKRKMVNGSMPSQSFDSNIAAQAQTIASSVAYPTRLLDTVYQNTTPRIKIVVITVTCQVLYYNPNGIFGTSFVTVKTDAAAAPTTTILTGGNQENTTGSAGQGTTLYYPVTFFVLPNHYYTVVTTVDYGGQTPVLTSWAELTLRN